MVEALLVDLNKVYNRGLSDGYYLGRPQGWSGAYGSKATHQKILRGKVVNYFAKIGVAEVSANAALECGEDFLIIGPSSGVVEGKLEEIRLDTGVTESVAAGDVFSFKVSSPVRRNDQFFILAPTASAATASASA
jgi:putative protease